MAKYTFTATTTTTTKKKRNRKTIDTYTGATVRDRFTRSAFYPFPFSIPM